MSDQWRRFWARKPLRDIARVNVLYERGHTLKAIARDLGMRYERVSEHRSSSFCLRRPDQFCGRPRNELSESDICWWRALCDQYDVILEAERAGMTEPCPCCSGTGLRPLVRPTEVRA